MWRLNRFSAPEDAGGGGQQSQQRVTATELFSGNKPTIDLEAKFKEGERVTVPGKPDQPSIPPQKAPSGVTVPGKPDQPLPDNTPAGSEPPVVIDLMSNPNASVKLGEREMTAQEAAQVLSRASEMSEWQRKLVQQQSAFSALAGLSEEERNRAIAYANMMQTGREKLPEIPDAPELEVAFHDQETGEDRTVQIKPGTEQFNKLVKKLFPHIREQIAGDYGNVAAVKAELATFKSEADKRIRASAAKDVRDVVEKFKLNIPTDGDLFANLKGIRDAGMNAGSAYRDFEMLRSAMNIADNTQGISLDAALAFVRGESNQEPTTRPPAGDPPKQGQQRYVPPTGVTGIPASPQTEVPTTSVQRIYDAVMDKFGGSN